MELQPNNGKNLVIEVENRKFARYPVKTKLIIPEDKDIATIVKEYAKPHLQSGDIVFISEKAVAITQGRSYPLNSVKASWLATTLSTFVMKTPVGIGLGSPQTMQLAIEEVGVARILVAAVIGGLGKIVGVRGLFYIIAGDKARSIDGAVSYALPPYNTYVSKGPEHADQVAKQISQKLGVPVAIVDANDLGVNVLGASNGVDRKLVARAIKDNPLGQSDEQTPIGIIREILPQAAINGLRRAQLVDVQHIIEITNLLKINVSDFVWIKPEYIARQINSGEYFLIENQGNVMAAMSMRMRNNKMHIETLAVRKEFQSQGLGSLFIAFAKTLAKEQGYTKLHAYSFVDYNMEQFYLKKGFTKLAHLGYYHNHPYQCFEIQIL